MKRTLLNKGIILGLMGTCCLVIICVGLSVGTMRISVGQVLLDSFLPAESRDAQSSIQMYVVYNVRLPRIVLCTLTGISLGLCGCVMQNLLRNPLASPFTLGVSSGASFGASLAMVMGASIFNANFLFSGYSLVAFNAFLFGCISLVIVFTVARLSRNNMGILILTGTAVNSLFSAGVSILKYASGAETLKNLDTWLMGGFWGANWDSISLLAPLVIISIVILFFHAWDFNTMNAGEEIATTTGVNVKRLRIVSLVIVTLIASVTIAFTGVIGFIGLIAPHIARSMVGTDNRFLLPGSAMLGASVLLLSDTLARTVFLPQEIPVGIVTSVLGVPFFIFILTRKKKQLWG